jgi:hypothetical protein
MGGRWRRHNHNVRRRRRRDHDGTHRSSATVFLSLPRRKITPAPAALLAVDIHVVLMFYANMFWMTMAFSLVIFVPMTMVFIAVMICCPR